MTSEFDSESASMTRTEQALRRVADMNRKTMIDLLIESVNEQNKLYYVVDTNQKWVCFNDIRQEEIGLKRLMK
jgi:hydroxypyruvate isomerase